MVSISLCMIVRNEEKVLGRCLSCVRGFADEIIIVDTGSTDRTKEIAFSFTDKVYDFKWKDDFAATRNFAFSRGTGDYLFWLDADDVIRQEEWRKLMDLKRRLDMERPDVVMMKYAVGYDGDGAPSFFFYRERLLRRCGKAVWKGRIHEAVEPFGKVVREDIMIEHRKVGTGDPDRNLRIFEQMLREKGKLSPRDQYYYGKELYYHRRYRDAASVFSEYLELPDGWREDRVDACRHGAYCMYRIGDRDRAPAGGLVGSRGGSRTGWSVLYVPDFLRGSRSRSSAVISDGGSSRPGAIATQFSGTGRQSGPEGGPGRTVS